MTVHYTADPFVEVLTTVRRGTKRRMSAPDDHAVLDNHQFLDVVALHVKVGIAPTTCLAASTVKVDKDRYKGRADISNTVQDRNRPSMRIANHSARWRALWLRLKLGANARPADAFGASHA